MLKFDQTSLRSKVRRLGPTLFAAMTGFISLGFAVETNSLMKGFSVSASAIASASNPDLIDISVNVTNVSDKPIELTTIEGRQPFMVRIYNDRGEHIDRDKRQLSKDRTHKESKVRFLPGEMKNYKTTLSTVKDVQGKEDRLPAGTYSVQIVFPVVSYVEGKYLTELVESQPVKIEVKLKDPSR